MLDPEEIVDIWPEHFLVAKFVFLIEQFLLNFSESTHWIWYRGQILAWTLDTLHSLYNTTTL